MRGIRLTTPTAQILDESDLIGFFDSDDDEVAGGDLRGNEDHGGDNGNDEQLASTRGSSKTRGQAKKSSTSRGVSGSGRKGKERDREERIRFIDDWDVEMESTSTMPSLPRARGGRGGGEVEEEPEIDWTRDTDEEFPTDHLAGPPPGQPIADVDESDSDYGFDFDFDAGFIEELDKKEQEKIGQPISLFQQKSHAPKASKIFPPNQRGLLPKYEPDSDPDFESEFEFDEGPQVGKRKGKGKARDDEDMQGTNQTLVGSSSITTGTHTQATLVTSSARRGTQQTQSGTQADPIDVIVIDSSDDEKENIPVETRRVRRRVSVASDVSIIDLSSD